MISDRYLVFLKKKYPKVEYKIALQVYGTDHMAGRVLKHDRRYYSVEQIKPIPIWFENHRFMRTGMICKLTDTRLHPCQDDLDQVLLALGCRNFRHHYYHALLQ